MVYAATALTCFPFDSHSDILLVIITIAARRLHFDRIVESTRKWSSPFRKRGDSTVEL